MQAANASHTGITPLINAFTCTQIKVHWSCEENLHNNNIMCTVFELHTSSLHCASILPYKTGYLFTNVPGYPVNLHNYWCCVCMCGVSVYMCVWTSNKVWLTTGIISRHHSNTKHSVWDLIHDFNILQKCYRINLHFSLHVLDKNTWELSKEETNITQQQQQTNKQENRFL